MMITYEQQKAVDEFIGCRDDEERFSRYSIEHMKNLYYLVMGKFDDHHAFEWAKNSDIFIEDFARYSGSKYHTLGGWVIQVNKCNNIALEAFANNEEVINALHSNDKYNYIKDCVFDGIGSLLVSPKPSDEFKDALRDIVQRNKIVDNFLNYEDFHTLHNEHLFGISDEDSRSYDEKVRKRVNSIRRDVVRKAFYGELPKSFDLNILI